MPNSKDALIGYTGFVGSNILNQRPFDFLFNSKNIEGMQNRGFGLVICAGAPGTKWIANKEPEKDLLNIKRLISNLQNIKCEKFVLISSIDVYGKVEAVDEDSPVPLENHPYGKHRRILEEFVAKNFNATIIRLPGLFGKNLKKNVIFDLLNGAEVNLNPDSLVQFYWLKHIWQDIQRTLKNNLPLVNFATEPIILKEIILKIFKLSLTNQNKQSSYYDMRSKYHRLWGIKKPYLYSKEQVLDDLKKYLDYR